MSINVALNMKRIPVSRLMKRVLVTIVQYCMDKSRIWGPDFRDLDFFRWDFRGLVLGDCWDHFWMMFGDTLDALKLNRSIPCG